VQASAGAARGPGRQDGGQICCQTEQTGGSQAELATGVEHPVGLGELDSGVGHLVGLGVADSGVEHPVELGVADSGIEVLV